MISGDNVEKFSCFKFLGTHITKEKKAELINDIKENQSVQSGACATVYYANCSASNKIVPQRLINTDQYTTVHSLPSLDDRSDHTASPEPIAL